MSAKAVADMLAGAGLTAGGAAAAPTGVGAAVAAVGAALTAEGVATAGVGIAIAAAGINNYGGDKGQFDYYSKLACEEFQNKWNEILEKAVKRPANEQPNSSTRIYDRKDSKGFATAKADFDSLGLSDLRTIKNSRGYTTYLGKTPDGKTVNLHFSSTENNKWCIEFGKIKIRY